MNKHEEYYRQVQLMLRILPIIYRIDDFAVHGGTAINLFHRNMPRYSVDIDLTYIPLVGRAESLSAINLHLAELKKNIERVIPGIQITHKKEVWKLLCRYDTVTVKIEVNGTKRGLLGEAEIKTLCEAASNEFHLSTKCRTVSFTQLYGGKIAAALSRQHPRDLFDCKYLMEDTPFEQVRNGLLFCLAGSDKPIHESILPHDVNQQDALENQFAGMTDIPFTYEQYEQTRQQLHHYVLDGFSSNDKSFLISFEQGEPDWSLCAAGDLSRYPSVQWKLLNLNKLKQTNYAKLQAEADKLRGVFFK